MTKKGQITFFIIIGIILLIIAGSYFALRSSLSNEPLVQPEYQPIQQFVNSCIEATAKEAMFLLGQNSGHIYVPAELNNPLLFYEKTPVQTYQVPFWWFEGKSFIPTEEYVADQINQYINEKIKVCLDFSLFENAYEIVPKRDKPVIKTVLNEENTVIEVSYPLTITKKSTKEVNTNIQEFKVIIPIRVKKALNLAQKIMQSEEKDKFVEEKTLDLIAMTGENEIPYTGSELRCGRRTWEVKRIERVLKDKLVKNFDFIKVKGTAYAEDDIVDTVKGTSFKDSYYGLHYVWDLGEESFPGMHVSVSVKNDSSFRMLIRPNDGRFLRSNAEQGAQLLSFICWNIWHFTYDITYPVLITIYDDQTPVHDEYRFKFAFQAAIEQNKPSRRSMLSSVFEPVGSIDLETYCSTDETDKEITLKLNDVFRQKPAEDVHVSFACGNAVCDLGTHTEEFKGRLPFCNNAVITATKEDYQESKTFIQTEEDSSYTLDLMPLISFKDIEVVKHAFLNERDSDGNLLEPGQAQKLGERETALITLSSDDHSSNAVYPSTSDSTDQLVLQIPAIPDRIYKISITLIKGDITGEPEVIGGYEGEFQMDDYELQIVHKVKFHVLEFKPKNEEENFFFLSGLNSYSQMIPKPEIIG